MNEYCVIIEQEEKLPGCHTQGDSVSETVKNIKEAIELCLECDKENNT